ncbi:hypothetical protein ABDM40_12710 [Klebsiella pneumoniae]
MTNTPARNTISAGKGNHSQPVDEETALFLAIAPSAVPRGSPARWCD